MAEPATRALGALLAALAVLLAGGGVLAGDCGSDPAMTARRQALSAVGRQTSEAEAAFALAQTWRGGEGAGCRPSGQDLAQAAHWLERAAELGHPEAQAALGDAFEHGLGVAKDYGQAFAWYHKAAAQGHVRSIFRIGAFHDFGLAAGPKDAGVAAAWYDRAARRGSCDARFVLASMYAKGRGLDPDRVAAYALYDLVAERAYPVPCYGKDSGDAGRLRDGLDSEMGEAEIAEARRRARDWDQP